MAQLAAEDQLLHRPQRRRHALGSLAKFNELLGDRVLGKARRKQPRLKMREIPAIKRASFITLCLANTSRCKY